MKHEVKITLILLSMFVLTQLIGLYIIDAYSPKIITQVINGTSMNVTVSNDLPYGMQPPEMKPQISLLNILISLVIAIAVFFLLTKIKARIALKIWFTLVIYITLSLSIYALVLKLFPALNANMLALIIALPLTFYKAIRPNLIVHNATELLVYPGLAAVFVPILRTWSIIVLLIIISVYDMWAVWKSSLMVNLARYQIRTMKVFTGFFVPYLPKGVRLSKTGKGKKVKISIASLGGGDVAFPLIFSGVVYRAAGLIPALMIVAGATLSLILLFIYSKKGKFYPAMPFLTAGCLFGWIISLLI
jgi:presenilin-like A22 family membrane protease